MQIASSPIVLMQSGRMRGAAKHYREVLHSVPPKDLIIVTPLVDIDCCGLNVLHVIQPEKCTIGDPEDTPEAAWGKYELEEFKALVDRTHNMALLVGNKPTWFLFVCNAGKNRSRALYCAVSLRLGHPIDMDDPKVIPEDPYMVDLVRLLGDEACNEYDKLTRWPPEGSKAKERKQRKRGSAS